MIRITLKNIQRKSQKRWDTYCLNTTNIDNDKYVATIFETDQIQFILDCGLNFVSARIFIGIAELRGTPIPTVGSSEMRSFNFMPKSNNKYGYESFFLHYCGIAQISAVLVEQSGREQRVLFESINVCGRKITSDRVVSILEYLSNNVTKPMLDTLSPTKLKSSLVKNGVSIADRLQLLERTLNEIDGSVRAISVRPLKSLRPVINTIYNPTPEKLSSDDFEWIVENSGQSVEAESSEVALFRHGLKWRTLHQMKTIQPVASTDIEENIIIGYLLNSLRRTAAEISHECLISNDTSVAQTYEEGGEYYANFYSIANRMLNSLGESYYHRSKECLAKIIALIKVFEGSVPTSQIRPSKLRPTLKMQANPYYMQIVRSMHEWLEKREVVWIEKHLFSSVNSTWKLFEYYLVINVHTYLCERSGLDIINGLFSGFIGRTFVRLLYAPKISTVEYSTSGDSYVVVDRYTGRYREPDIVIELSRGDDLQLLIFDAKCRSEHDVWSDLRVCELKYTGSIRHRRTGKPVVSAMILPYPMTSEHQNDSFQDYYEGPYSIDGALSCVPVMGIQRVPITSGGIYGGYIDLLGKLLDRFTDNYADSGAEVTKLKVS